MTKTTVRQYVLAAFALLAALAVARSRHEEWDSNDILLMWLASNAGALLLVIWPRWAAWQVAALVAFVATVVFVMWSVMIAGPGHPFSHWGQV